MGFDDFDNQPDKSFEPDELNRSKEAELWRYLRQAEINNLSPETIYTEYKRFMANNGDMPFALVDLMFEKYREAFEHFGVRNDKFVDPNRNLS